MSSRRKVPKSTVPTCCMDAVCTAPPAARLRARAASSALPKRAVASMASQPSPTRFLRLSAVRAAMARAPAMGTKSGTLPFPSRRPPSTAQRSTVKRTPAAVRSRERRIFPASCRRFPQRAESPAPRSPVSPSSRRSAWDGKASVSSAGSSSAPAGRHSSASAARTQIHLLILSSAPPVNSTPVPTAAAPPA